MSPLAAARQHEREGRARPASGPTARPRSGSEPTTRRELSMSVTCAPGPTSARRTRRATVPGAVPSVCTRNEPTASLPVCLGDVARVRDEERVRRRGRELLGHAGVVERHGLNCFVRPFCSRSRSVSPGCSWKSLTVSAATSTESGRCASVSISCEAVPPCEPRVLQLAGRADRRRAHAVEVLQVGADVGEAVLQRLDAAHARHARPDAAPRPAARRVAPGDSVTVTSAPLVSRASTSACCW